jgi:hypothetical protein
LYAQSYIQNYTANYIENCRFAINCPSTAKGGNGSCFIERICEPIAMPIVTCTSSFNEKTESCPPNYSGYKKYTQEVSICTNGTTKTNGWKLYSDTCVANPPSCQVSSQTQTLSCQTGYTGSITQTRTSSCPDPYQPSVWQPWVTTTDSCVKSVTNPTNPTSPISPISQPPAPPPPASTPPPAPPPAPSAEAPMPTNSVTSNAPTAVGSAPQPTAQPSAGGTQSSNPPPKGKINVGGLGLALSLELIVKTSLPQPNLFPTIEFGQSIPKEILFNDQTMMSLLQVVPLTQEPLKENLDFTQ